MSEYYFRTQQLTVGYDGKPLISDIDISIEKGEIVTLIGPNGSGKSTILKSITRQLRMIGGKVFIATGYGVEGALPDALCRRIIENKLIPAFRTGDYEAGVWDALAVMMPILKGEYDAEEYMEQEDEMGAEDIIAIVFFLAIFLYILYWSSHGGGTGTGTGGRNTGTWGGPPIIFTGGSDWGGSSRSGGFGGGFGGGWGGFGGGSFGGGGAGGSW